MFGSEGSAPEVAGSRPFRYLSYPTRISHFFRHPSEMMLECVVGGGRGGEGVGWGESGWGCQDGGVGRRVIYQQQQQTCRQNGSYCS